MEEIKVGEYVRTGHGNIFKVSKTTDFGMNNVFPHDENGIMIVTQITKHSPNIIDLIEAGDYVNGYKVTSVCNEEPCPSGKCVDIDCDRPSEFCTLWVTDIKEIVTKEQYNSIKYVIGE